MLLEPSQEEVVKTLLELETAQCPRNRTLVVTPLRATSPRESSILSAPTHTIRAFQEPNF